jgi:hypothetical protein
VNDVPDQNPTGPMLTVARAFDVEAVKQRLG